MELLYNIFSILTIIVAILLIILILMQKTKGAEIGAIFGSGAAAAVLGAGASNILTKITFWLGGIFLFLVFSLSYIHHQHLKQSTILTNIPEQTNSQPIDKPVKNNSK